jgi:acyl-CoA synthetase (AMP-forming)/AMP-acid ligase II
MSTAARSTSSCRRSPTSESSTSHGHDPGAAPARYEDRDCIVTANRRLTFGEAELQSRRLAKHLLRAGIGKGTRVGFLFPQGPDFVVALLAVCRIGAVAVPLSTFFRGPELRRAVRHVDVHTGLQHKIVDPETGGVQADGVEGEICVRGYRLMDGLYKRERRNTFDDDGWYHTGDRGFFRDGLLFFTGRRSEMIKTGGANVAPREVELAVEALPGIQAAFVVGIPDAARGQLVACLVCPDDGQELDAAALRAALAEVLSSFKIPRRFLVLPFADVPSLGTGKIDKPRIAEMFAARDS